MYIVPDRLRRTNAPHSALAPAQSPKVQPEQQVPAKRSRPAIPAKAVFKIHPLTKVSAKAIENLSREDQARFQAFGVGADVTPRFSMIHLGFEHFACRQPDALAVEMDGDSMTYAELNDHANRLAARLQASGVGPGDAVGLFVSRSIAMVVGILGVLKTGAAYVPQHIGVAPSEALAHITRITAAKVVLTLSKHREQVPTVAGCSYFSIDELIRETGPGEQPHKIRDLPITPHDRCFILFTSGTTGVPNGVQVTHRNVCNILQTAPGDLGIRPGMKVAQLLSIAFDMAAWEILGCLSNGGSLLLRGHDFQATAERADVVIATPSILNGLDAGRCGNVKVAAVAGEPCPRPLADAWSGFCTFYNSCGPTETTIINTAEVHQPDKSRLTIGRPTPNNTVYVLNDSAKPCAIGEVGEMWAGGDCVTAGYIGNDALTAERYRPDPFLGNGRMMFRTRDLGRWTEDGELEHLGRVDDQVKVRGFRVELDSVTSVLETTPDCAQAATLKLNDRELVAFVSPESVDVSTARSLVRRKLPYYCEPALIIAMDEFPGTARGKIDKRGLLNMAHTRRKAYDLEVV